MTPAETIEHALSNFDHKNKLRLGEMVVAALEARENDDVVERAQGVLNRTLSKEEVFRLRTLAEFYFSRQAELPDGEFGYKAVMTF